MRLAEALQLRSDLQKRIYQLQERLNQNATVQEGEKPAEDPVALLHELDGCIAQLEELMERINRTNSQTVTAEGTLTALLAKRDCLKIKVEAYREFLRQASGLSRRATRSEIKILSTISVQDYQKQVDQMSAQLRQVDGAIQAANWTTELL
ncbi:MAG: DIP1984 family protein [Oscillospiraceae bacterium]|jgi:uncharacterized coiled-coil DUF342 family protein|nr:DIP1984 family protein [Oscillospiraceae bacterium]MCI9587766.1 DIP1984 family protein [Oscillospiraceae bacterium]